MNIGKMLAGSLVLSSLLPLNSLQAQTQSAEEELRLLRQKVEALEKKLEALENRTAPAATDTAKDQQIQELGQKVRIIERNRELEQEAAEAKAKEAPKVSIGEKGFSISSADTNYSLQIKGVLQVDSRTFFNDSGTAGNDGFLLRRARPILQGTIARDFDFLFVPEFGGSSPQIFDAYLNYRYKPELQLRAGKFKVPLGLEQLQSDKDTLFNERAFPTALVPNRDLGVQLHGDLFKGALSYAVGIFNGIGDGRNSTNLDYDDNKAVAGRLFAQPFKNSSSVTLQNLGFGIAGTYQNDQRTNSLSLPNGNGYATPAQQQFFAYRSSVTGYGEHWRLSPQAYWYYGPFSLLSEYVISDQQVRTVTGTITRADLQHTAWQVALGYVLTGEDATFTGVVPRRPFKPSEGQWGAFQVVARYSELKTDDSAFPTFANPAVSAHAAQEYAVGLNWYLNRNVRVNLGYSHVNFQGGGGAGATAPASVTRTDEDVLFTRIQLAF